MPALSRESWIGVGAAALAVAAMAVDHLLDEDGGLADPPVFAISVVLIVVVTAVVFGRVVPAVKVGDNGPRRAVSAGFFSAPQRLALVIPLGSWLGLPFPLAAGAFVLGVRGRDSDRRGASTVVAAIGAVIVLLGVVGFAVLAVEKLFEDRSSGARWPSPSDCMNG